MLVRVSALETVSGYKSVCAKVRSSVVRTALNILFEKDLFCSFQGSANAGDKRYIGYWGELV